MMTDQKPSMEGHRESSDGFSPDNYSYVTQIDAYLANPGAAASNFSEASMQWAAAAELQHSKQWAEKLDSKVGNCAHCGSRLRYSVVLQHDETGEYIGIGHTCMSNRFSVSEEKFNLDRLKEHAQRMRTMEENGEYRRQFIEDHPEMYEMIQKADARPWEYSAFWKDRADHFNSSSPQFNDYEMEHMEEALAFQKSEAYDYLKEQYVINRPNYPVARLDDFSQIQEAYQDGSQGYNHNGPNYFAGMTDVTWQLIKNGDVDRIENDDCNDFVAKLANNLFKFDVDGYNYPTLTENQMECVIDNMREEESAQAEVEPVPEGKGVEIEGEIIKTDTKHSQYGEREVMVVEHEDGWRVWGSIPQALKYEVYEGDEVKFVANVERSDDDDFGFFKRPRQAEQLSGDGEE